MSSFVRSRPFLTPRSLALLVVAVMLHAAAALAVTQLGHTPAPIRPPQILEMAWFGQQTQTEAPPPARTQAPPKVHKKLPHPVKVVHHVPQPKPEPVAPPPVLAAAATPEAVPDPATVQAPVAQAQHTDAAPEATDDSSRKGTQTAQANAGPTFRPDYLNNPHPSYPDESRTQHEQGRVMLRVHIGTDGRTTEVVLKQSSGFARLDASAMAAVRAWRFLPARQGETPVASWVVIPIDFKLENTVS